MTDEISPREQVQAPSHRARVELLLALFADLKAQAAREFGPDPETVPQKLCRRWFDEVYVPGAGCFEPGTLKGDVSPALLAEFETEFSSDDLLQLERFHCFLELRIGMLRKSATPVDTWSETVQWGAVARNARATLELLRLAD